MRVDFSKYIKKVLRKTLFHYRLVSSSAELGADVMLIGAQRSGTTFLNSALISHPSYCRALKVGLNFFSLGYSYPKSYYYAQYPSQRYKKHRESSLGGNLIFGESNPYYIFHPRSAERARSIVPNVKILVLLRNPTERAISHYYHNVKEGRESLGIKEAMDAEDSRLEGELEKMMNDPLYNSTNYQHYSYKARGRYAEQIERWEKYFPKGQFLFLKSEDMFSNPQESFDLVCEFLGLPFIKLENTMNKNTGTKKSANIKIVDELSEYFRPYNEDLRNKVGIEWG